MSAYLVLVIGIEDEAQWRVYRDAVMSLIPRFGGRHVASGGTVDRLEGPDDGRRVVMFEFASVKDIHAFWSSPEYGPVRDLRRDAATLDAWAVPGG